MRSSCPFSICASLVVLFGGVSKAIAADPPVSWATTFEIAHSIGTIEARVEVDSSTQKGTVTFPDGVAGRKIIDLEYRGPATPAPESRISRLYSADYHGYSSMYSAYAKAGVFVWAAVHAVVVDAKLAQGEPRGPQNDWNFLQTFVAGAGLSKGGDTVDSAVGTTPGTDPSVRQSAAVSKKPDTFAMLDMPGSFPTLEAGGSFGTVAATDPLKNGIFKTWVLTQSKPQPHRLAGLWRWSASVTDQFDEGSPEGSSTGGYKEGDFRFKVEAVAEDPAITGALSSLGAWIDYPAASEPSKVDLGVLNASGNPYANPPNYLASLQGWEILLYRQALRGWFSVPLGFSYPDTGKPPFPDYEEWTRKNWR